MQQPGLNDAVLLLSLLYSVIDLRCEWELFDTCHRPIHRWLLVSYACIVTFRVTHLLGSQWASADAAGESSGAAASAAAVDFLLDLRQKKPVPFGLAVFSWLVVLPFFTLSTFVGTVWLYNVAVETPNCVPSSTHLYFASFWLALCYAWIAVHIALGIVAWTLETRVRRAERDLRAVEDEDVRSRWGPVSSLSSYASLAASTTCAADKGLSPAEIRDLKGLMLQPATVNEDMGTKLTETAVECSICISEIRPGESLRRLSSCGHTYHRSCIDLWLLRRPDCPLCKCNVRRGASAADEATGGV